MLNKNSQLFKAKTKHFVKMCFKIACTDTIAPIFDKSLFLQILILPVTLYITFLLQGSLALIGEVSSLIKLFIAVLITAPLWFLINIILSPFKAFKNIKEKGYWHENKFIYKSPVLVFSGIITPSSKEIEIDFVIVDVEPNAFVQLRAECEKGKAKILILPKSLRFKGFMKQRNPNVGVKLKEDKKVTIIADCPLDSDSTLVRIYMLYWQI